ncbi:MAG: SagB family peptide dehydrogenase [Alphaproteobacteria bacterium]|nr:SagB family peptide dehydrogenase [Alphaproteobacteria bacterium]
MAGPVRLLYHFNADVQSVRRDGNRMVLDVKDWKPIGFAPAHAAHAEAIAALEGRGSTLSELVRIASAGADLGGKAIHYYLDRFAFGRLLGWTIVDQEGELGRVQALAKLFVPRREPLPAGPVAMSRFAYLRRLKETMLLESGLVRARIELKPRGLALLGAILGAPCKAASESLAGALWQLGFFEAVDVEESAAQRCWEFHDLLLHEASRANREVLPVGGTYRFDGAIPPMSAVRPDYSGKRIALPAPDSQSIRQRSRSLDDLQAERKSIRDYADSPLPLDMLGEFLWRVCRTTGTLPLQHQDLLSRRYPAAGSVHELEFYVAARRCEDLRPSVHHYDSHNHALVEFEGSQKAALRIVEGCGRAMALQPGRLLPAAAIVVTSRLPRLAWKYEGMAYRASLMNTGVVYHLMYMVATDMGLAPCATGTGDSRLLEDAIGLDRLEETTIGEFALGMPAAAAAASSD